MKFLLILLLAGCSLFPSESKQKLSPLVYYKNDMCFSHDKGQFCGVGVIPQEDKTRIRINTKNDIDKFILTTCHREIDTDNPDKGLRRKNGIVNLDIVPTVEKNRACPYYFGSFNREGKHSWGIVAIKSAAYQLTAKAFCNGEISDVEGVFICQSKEGLLQKIIFDEEVILTKPVNGPAQRKSDCPPLKLSDNQKTLEYITPNRECLYGIIGKKSLKSMQLYTVGYEQLITR